jgi:hypothetical protein
VERNGTQFKMRNLDWAEDNLDHKWNWAPSKVKPPPKDYFVPDFGMD